MGITGVIILFYSGYKYDDEVILKPSKPESTAGTVNPENSVNTEP